MSDFLDELRALLFGAMGSHFARYRAPEPELIVEILPVMTNHLPFRALDLLVISHPAVIRLARIVSKTERLRLMKIFNDKLLDLPVTDREQIVLQIVYEAPELIDYLPEAVLDQILTLAHETVNEISQVTLLSKVVSRLPETERAPIIKEILDKTRQIALAFQAAPLVNVVPSLKEPIKRPIIEEALTATQQLGSSEKTRILTKIVPHLPKHLLDRLLNVVESLMEKDQTIVRAFLVPYLDEPIKTETVEVVLKNLGAHLKDLHIEQSMELIIAVGEMALELPEHAKNKVLSKALSGIKNIAYDEDRFHLIAGLAPYLTEEIAVNALALAETFSDNWLRARVLSALYPVLPDDKQKTVIDEVKAVSAEHIKELLMQLPAENRVAFLERVLTQFGYKWGGAPAPLMPPKGGVGKSDVSLNVGGFDIDEKVSVDDLPLSDGYEKQKRPPKKERFVNTGFSLQTKAEDALKSKVPLMPNHSYYFWFEIGELKADTIEEKPDQVDLDRLPRDARLKVVIFSYENEIEIIRGKDVGELQVMSDGTVKVIQQVVIPDSIPPYSKILKERLFFPVHVADKEGTFRLRCNMYYEQILVHSKLIQILVSRDQKMFSEKVLKSTTEYTISKSIAPRYLVSMTPQKLSIMLNSNSEGTHCFRLFGEDNFKGDASFNAQELLYLVKQARGALRRASWNDEDNWSEDKDYRYLTADMDQFKEDLVRFAIRGYRFYLGIVQKIVPGIPEVRKLKALMVKPAILEFVIKDKTEASNYMFPTSMVYDYSLNTSLPLEKYSLCPSFLKAMNEDHPLEETRCFKGDCPSRGNDSVICPSGFWGFRHSIGMPLGSASETNCEISYVQGPEITVSVYSDFDEWPQHKAALKKCIPQTVWNFSDTRLETLTSLQTTTPHVVYFYCHGGIAGEIPFIMVGGDEEEYGITPENLLNAEIWWENPQPLVFINGCHTTALEPKNALNFVTSFIKMHHAAGVIGTEITIFESLGRAFAEECLRLFLVEEKPIGDAIRETRLKLLKQGNPLGLVYNAYSNASLRLKKQVN